MRDRYGRDGATGLTDCGRRNLEAIDALWRLHGRPPTVRELAYYLGLGKVGQNVHDMVSRLLALGYVTREYATSRTLTLTDLGRRVLGYPHMVGEFDPQVQRTHRCPVCKAETFRAHKPETCRQLLTGVPFLKEADPIALHPV